MIKTRPLRPLIICSVLVIADQLTKVLAIRYLMPVGSVAIFSFFHLTYVENTGISFGMMRETSNVFFIAVNSLLTAGLYAYWRKHRHWGLMLILAGALGNLLDRFIRGYVVDFLDFRVWPVFNIADSLITVGVAFYILSAFQRTRQSQ